MKIIMLNYPYLQNELKQWGWQVVSAGTTSDCDLVFSQEDYLLENILRRSPFDPDFVIFADSLERQIPLGMEKCEIPLISIFLDSPINRFWQFSFSEISALSLFDQKPEADFLVSQGFNCEWFPLAADTEIYRPQSVQKDIDISFIGGRNPVTRMKRENILNLTQKHCNLKIYDGNPHLSARETAAIYNRSRLILNENLFPAINLRLFEAMACETAVLTEATAPGLNEIFRDGVDIISYSPDDLLEKTAYYLNHQAERESLSVNAVNSIRENHSFMERAGELSKLLTSITTAKTSDIDKRRISLAKTFAGMGLKWGDKYPGAVVEALNLLDSSDISNDAEAAILRGRLAAVSGNNTLAVRFFLQAGENKHSDFRPYLYAASTMFEAGDSAMAGECLKKALEISGNRITNNSPFKWDTEEFHLFWGQTLDDNGDALEQGMMKIKYPLSFWSALEHFRRAAEISRKNWVTVGDLLMRNQAPDAALQAYGSANGHAGHERISSARKGAYLDITPPGIERKECLFSLCMIVKNEEENLQELLPSITEVFDHIVIGDTGSTDNTLETARKFGAEVIEIPWTNDFAAARNKVIDKAPGKYIMYLDGDDRIDAEEFMKFKSILKSSKDEVYYVNLRDVKTGETCLQKRIFPNRRGLQFKGAIHEQIEADPEKFRLLKAPLTIEHRGYDNPEEVQKKSYRNLKIIERELVDNPKDYYLHYHAGICRMNLRQEMQAVEHWRKIAFSAEAASQNPDIFEHAIILLSRIFQRHGDHKTAANLLNNLLEIDLNSALGHYYLGMIYFEEQQYSECRLEMESFFGCSFEPKGIPMSRDKICGWAHYYLARCYEHQGVLGRAEGHFKQSLRMLDFPQKLFIDCARIKIKAADMTDAERILNECLNKYPRSRQALKMLEEITADTERI